MTPLDPQVALVFKIGSGLLWTVTYLLILHRGRKDRALGMPLAALGANLGWEFLFSFVYPHASPQLEVNRVWFVFDLAILVQALRYGGASQTGPWLRKAYPAAVALAVGLGTVLVWAITVEFQDWQGMYAAFGQNLMMSILFVSLLLSRGTAGQSLWIALSKFLGTLLPSLLFHFKYPGSVLLHVLFAGILCFDALYLAALWARLHREGGKAWSRW